MGSKLDQLQFVTLSHVETIHESRDRYTFAFSPDKPIRYSAGQYAHALLADVDDSKPVRKLSFASGPGDNDVRFTVRIRPESRYKQALMNLQPGDKLRLFKIKGKLHLPSSGDVIFIAGGVGMAPFRSMLRDISTRGLAIDTTVIQIDRREYLYAQEFATADFPIHYETRETLSNRLTQTVQDHSHATYYVVGAESLVEDVTRQLRRLGISDELIQADEFDGYTEA